MPDCRCEPCGNHCSCKCHDRKQEMNDISGSSPTLIGADPEISQELR